MFRRMSSYIPHKTYYPQTGKVLIAADSFLPQSVVYVFDPSSESSAERIANQTGAQAVAFTTRLVLLYVK